MWATKGLRSDTPPKSDREGEFSGSWLRPPSEANNKNKASYPQINPPIIRKVHNTDSNGTGLDRDVVNM